MRNFTLSLTLSVGLALVGCSTPAPLVPARDMAAPQVHPSFEPGDLVLRLQIGDSRMLQAGGDAVVVYAAEDVAKVVITAFIKVDDAFVPMSTAGKPTTATAADRLTVTTMDRYQTLFHFKNLPPDQTYRFMAQAFDADENLISQDAASVTEVTFQRYDYEDTPTLQLKLKDKPFMGMARAEVSFGNGLGQAQLIRFELYKKGMPDVKVGNTIELSVADLGSGRSIVLGGLAPDSAYVLQARAYADDGTTELGGGSAEWQITGNDQELDSQSLVVTLQARVSSYVGTTHGYQEGSFPEAKFNGPRAVLAAPNGNIYVADWLNRRIRTISDGQVSTLVGNGKSEIIVGTGAFASIGEPYAMAIDSNSNLFVVSEASNGKIQVLKVTPGGAMTIFATVPKLPIGLSIDKQDNLYMSSYSDHRIMKYTPAGVSSIWAGSGSKGSQDGIGEAASFTEPRTLTIDSEDNLYVSEGNRIRKITPQQEVTTLAGTGSGGNQDGPALSATFYAPFAMAWASDGSLYFTSNSSLRRLHEGMVTTVAGKNEGGFKDGLGSEALFSGPRGLSFLSDGSLLVADSSNSKIRRIVFPWSN